MQSASPGRLTQPRDKSMFSKFWVAQLMAVLRKNLAVKLRNRKATFSEVLWPMYFVFILVIMARVIPTVSFSKSGMPSQASSLAAQNQTTGFFSSIPTAPQFLCLFQDKESCDFSKVAPSWIEQSSSSCKFAYVNPSPGDSSAFQVADRVKKSVFSNLIPHLDCQLQEFESEDSLDSALRDENSNFRAALVFHTDFNGYTVRVGSENLPGEGQKSLEDTACRINYRAVACNDKGCKSSNPVSSKQNSEACLSNGFLRSLFVALQVATDEALATVVHGAASAQISTQVTTFGLDAASAGLGTSSSSAFLAMYVPLGLGLFLQYFCIFVVTEKEKGLRDYLKVMGLRSSVAWISWYLTYFLIELAVSVVTSVLLKFAGVVPKADVTLLFVGIFLYLLSLISFGLLLSTFISTARACGGAASAVVLLGSVVFTPFSAGVNLPAVGAFFLSLAPPFSASVFFNNMFILNAGIDGRTGGTWANIDVEGLVHMSTADVLIMMTVNIILYAVLAAYLDQVLPSANCNPKHPLFFLGYKQQVICKSSSIDQCVRDQELDETAALKIRSLTKVFMKDMDTPVAAVDAISLDIPKGQIFGLLGHNGAGKSTTIGMLTGLHSVTSGDATVFGLSLANDMEAIHESMGVCMQQNTLYDDLTVGEHVSLIAGIRGKEGHELESSARELLAGVGLGDRWDDMAKDLSGGQKRRLCTAMALIGDPDIVLVDEPTTGLDPASRRMVWDLLKARREGRVIILTTHFMDEADVLADTKAIMAHGKLMCCGSSLFLKETFGHGFRLTVEPAKDYDDDNALSQIQKLCRGATLDKATIGRFDRTFLLPKESISGTISTFLEKLESRLSEIRIANFGFSLTSLEEVFLRIAEDGSMPSDAPFSPKSVQDGSMPSVARGSLSLPSRANDAESKAAALLRGGDVEGNSPVVAPFFTQVLAIWNIRFKSFTRNKATMFFSVLYPAMFLIVSAVLGQLTSKAAGKAGGEIPLVGGTDSPLLSKDGLNYFAVALDSTVSQAQFQKFANSIPTNVKLVCWSNPSADIRSIDAASCSADGLQTRTISQTQGLEQNWNSLVWFHMLPSVSGGVGKRLDLKYTIVTRNNAAYSLPSSIAMVDSAAATSFFELTSKQEISFEYIEAKSQGPQFSTGFIFFALAFTVILPMFIGEQVRERETKARAQLNIMGCRILAYWAGSFIHDVSWVMLQIFVALICNAILKNEPFSGEAIGPYLVLSVLYVPAILLFAYVVSSFFKVAENVYRFGSVIMIFAVLIPTLVVLIAGQHMSSTLRTTLMLLFTAIFPPFGMVGACFAMFLKWFSHQFEIIYGASSSPLTAADYLALPEVYGIMIVLVFYWFVGFGLLYALDIRQYLHTRRPASDTALNPSLAVKEDLSDPDVEAEMEDIDNDKVNHCPIVTSHLKKVFDGGKVAVSDVSFAVTHGQCFCLLGPNGAGKSTTLNMMTGEVQPTGGFTRICSYEIGSQTTDAFQHLGYAPQHDPLFINLTTEEHLQAYATIKGMSRENRDFIVPWIISRMNLDEHAMKKSSELSGGSKRKLCAAIAFIGSPDAVILDEPSSGMDVSTRRWMWDIVQETKKDKSIILTTHSMEECEALSDRLTILVNGKLRCIGSAQHLKAKYGMGYMLDIKVDAGKSNEEEAAALILRIFPNSQVQDSFWQGRATWSVPAEKGRSMSSVFRQVEEAISELNAKEWSLSQTTLEQVYLQLAKEQITEEE